jgi:flagella basal body P-ring formation protein FlgA
MRSGVLAVLFICLLVNIAAAYDPEVIIKKERVTVAKDKIYLGDIADFSGLSSEDADDLASIYIKRAALPGYGLKVTKANVFNQVKKEFRYIKVSGPETVEVFTEKSAVKRQDLIAAAEKFVYDNMPWKKEDVIIEVKGKQADVDVMGGEVLLKVREDSRTDFLGNVIVPVEITADGRFCKLEPVSLLVKVTTECLIASEDIHAREPLAGRVKSERKEITFMPGGILTNPAQASNKIAKRNIMAGTILVDGMFESAPLFRRGSQVSVVVKVRNISVETTGTSFEEGREGGTVKVKLISGKVIEGKVAPDGKVIIEK